MNDLLKVTRLAVLRLSFAIVFCFCTVVSAAAQDAAPVQPVPGPVSATALAGNGHAQTWDGRVFVKTTPYNFGWVVAVLRPEAVERRAADGAPLLDEGDAAFSEWVPFLANAASGFPFLNGLAINPRATSATALGGNPFRSDALGNYVAGGDYLTYELVLVTQNPRQENTANGPFSPSLEDRLGRRDASVTIRHPFTGRAEVERVLVGSFEEFRSVDGQRLRGIEPTLTFDGHLMVWQGHVNNDGNIDQLVYSVNQASVNDGSTTGQMGGWSTPRSVLAMAFETQHVSGVPFVERFPIAQQRWRGNDGAFLGGASLESAAGVPYPGGYPWISRDGSELFHTATKLQLDLGLDEEGNPTPAAQCGCPGVVCESIARRAGLSVIGRATGFTLRHIDGPLNPDRTQTRRLFFSSAGFVPGMWTPYREVPGVAIPYTRERPLYPMFGTNSESYGEVTFEDHVDGDYQLVLHMNEALREAGGVGWAHDLSHTPDTSGHHNTATLMGQAQFPQEYFAVDKCSLAYRDVDRNWGVGGSQAIYFREGDWLEVEDSASLNDPGSGLTVEMWVLRECEPGEIRHLAHRPGAWKLELEADGRLRVSLVTTAGGAVVPFAGPAIPQNVWTHVAFSYEPASGEVRIYQNGDLVSSQTLPGAPSPLVAVSSNLIVGPGGQGVAADPTLAQLRLDELRISRVVRSPREIARSAFRSAEVEGPAGLTVELWVDRIADHGGIVTLAERDGSWKLELEANGQLRVTIHTETSTWLSPFAGQIIAVGERSHVGFSYRNSTGELRIYQDGDEVRAVTFPGPPSALQTSAADLVTGSHATTGVGSLDVRPVAQLDLPFGLPTGLARRDLRLSREVSEAQIALGKKLFFDPRLSSNGKVACSSCHDPAHGFSDGFPTSTGVSGEPLARNAASVINRAFSTTQLWDGRAASLEAQARLPIEHADEMGLPVPQAVAVVAAVPEYVAEFQGAYGGTPSEALLLEALADYQRSLISGGSRVDLFEAGDLSALDSVEQQGRLLFHGKARCVACHVGPNFTDEDFHDTGFFAPRTDLGRFDVTGRESDRGRFKTPTLRDLTHSAPYLHDGSAATLSEVVETYNAGGHAGRDPEIRPLGLSGGEVAALVAFLEALESAPENNLQGNRSMDRSLPVLPGNVEPARNPRTFVEQLYQDLLGRSADAGGLAHYTGLILQGASWQDVANIFLSSDEHLGRWVEDGYQTYLDRAADSAGLDHYIAWLRQHETLHGFWITLATSSEALGDPPISHHDFATKLYRDVLEREPDPNGLAWLISEVADHGHVHAASLMFGSPERRQLEIDAAYDELLGRDPTVDELASTEPLFQLRRTIVTGDEYYQRAFGN